VKTKWGFFGCILLIFVLIFFNLTLGKVNIPLEDIYKVLTFNSTNEVYQNLILNYRLPKIMTTILVGLALPIAGFLLQELFKNPLAEPSVLGITAMSGLGVAIVVFLFSLLGLDYFLTNSWVMIFAAIIGAFVALLVISGFSYRTKTVTSLIILGMMLSGLAIAIIGVLQYFAPSEKLKIYLIWSFGTLSALSWQQIFVFGIFVLTGVLLAFSTLPSLTFLMLGEKYAQSLGVNLKKLRWIILISTAILTASVTAFAGPISFIGLAVPHICRTLLRTTNMYLLFVWVMLFGVSLMLIFSILTDVFPFGTLPINIITSLFGTPIVMSILLKKSKVVL